MNKTKQITERNKPRIAEFLQAAEDGVGHPDHQAWKDIDWLLTENVKLREGLTKFADHPYSCERWEDHCEYTSMGGNRADWRYTETDTCTCGLAAVLEPPK